MLSTTRYGCTWLALALAIALCTTPETHAAKAGFAERDITPDIGMEQAGGYTKVFHRSLHDPCKVRVAVFDDGQNRSAIVGVDAMAISRELVLDCRQVIEDKCGIPQNSIMISASHSHSSGPIGLIPPGQYDHASALIQKLAYEESPTDNPGYVKRVREAIVDAVCAANNRRADVQCGFGSGSEDKVAFNRRFRMRGGFVQTHPGQGNPEIIGPAGPTDPEVGVVAAWNSEGQLIGCIVNFSCHATTSPGGISANYIYYLEQIIRQVMGDDVVVVFTAGASGDVTQVDNLSPHQSPKAEEWAKLVGGRVGAEAIKVMLSMERTSEFLIDTRSRVITIKRRAPNADDVTAAMELLRKPREEVARGDYIFAKETALLDALLVKEPDVDVEMQVVQIGPAVFVSNPAEYFCQFGLEIKQASAFPLTFPVTLANGYVGYVPTEEALGPNGGGYETILTSYSNLVANAGDRIAQECISLIKELTPGTLPTRPKVTPFRGSGWSYGKSKRKSQ